MNTNKEHIGGRIDEDDRLYKFMLKCRRNANKPDLHSFKIETKKGTAFVECRDEEVRIDLFIGNEKKIFVLTYIAAANKLDQLGADMNTVYM